MKIRHFAGPLVAAAAMFLVACGGDGAAPATDAPSAPAAAVEAPAVQPAAEAVAAGPAPGEKVYQSTCVLCHGSPAVGAPVLGNKEDWAPRIAQGKDVLYKHALEGFTGAKGTMPPHGGNPSIDEASIKEAVDYMVGKSQ